MRLTAYTRGILALPVLKNGSRQAEGGEDVNVFSMWTGCLMKMLLMLRTTFLFLDISNMNKKYRDKKMNSTDNIMIEFDNFRGTV
jgi:hypothetical protein